MIPLLLKFIRYSMTLSVSKSKMIRIKWPEAASTKQLFLLPSSIIYYITKNPSTPKCYSKMIQCCKYFFEKNPILVVGYMDEDTICSKDECTKECCLALDINDTICKFWLTSTLMLYRVPPNFISTFIPKNYQCDIKNLSIYKAKINFNDFKMLASSADILRLANVSITSDDGKPVMLEAVIEAIPNVKEFLFKLNSNIPIVTGSTVKNITNLKNLSNLRRLTLFWVPEAFNLDDIIAFAKTHKDIKIQLYYSPAQFSQEYKTQLDAVKKLRKQFGYLNLFVSYKNWAFPLQLIFRREEDEY